MANHSPGPFTAEPAGDLQDDGKFEQTIIRDATGCEIARCSHWLVDAQNGNVALFTASEEMLSVLDALVKWNANPNGNGLGLERICRRAKKAVVKARGDSLINNRS